MWTVICSFFAANPHETKEKQGDCDARNNYPLTRSPRGSILFLMNPHKSTQSVDAIPTHVAPSAP